MSTSDTHDLPAQLASIARQVRAGSTTQAGTPIPGMPARRLEIYRDLVRNNLRSLFASNFPVLQQTLAPEQWQQLIDSFLHDHRAHTPLFTAIGFEFVEYVAALADDVSLPAWLPELAHYEWVELALQIADATLPAHDPDGDLLTGTPVLSPTAWPLAYRWPVHQIGPQYQPAAPPGHPTLLLAHRDGVGDIRFAALSAIAYALLDACMQQDAPVGEHLLRSLAAQAQAVDVDGFIADGHRMLQQWRAAGIVLGARTARPDDAASLPTSVAQPGD